ncbi:Colicin V production protein [Tepidimonas thermarum]|uniref:Colicin V production protein n=1 Tax=Tepidimonas thermarum TaxID=335431 RepID=A0A554X663_9BURK|nr:CvpA family protein [Tepidimonas thermarum]TSE31297.1 Colicin V production protein [Tepidimonas thermarum]
MATVDIVLLVVLGASVVIGLWRGLLYEVLSVLGWIVAFVVAQRWALQAADSLPLAHAAAPLRYAAGFAVLFVLTAFVAGWVAWLAQRGAQLVGLRPVDRALGGLFGLVRGVVLLLAAALLIRLTPWADSAAWREAVGPRWLGQGLQVVKGLAPPAVAAYFP